MPQRIVFTDFDESLAWPTNIEDPWATDEDNKIPALNIPLLEYLYNLFMQDENTTVRIITAGDMPHRYLSASNSMPEESDPEEGPHIILEPAMAEKIPEHLREFFLHLCINAVTIDNVISEDISPEDRRTERECIKAQYGKNLALLLAYFEFCIAEEREPSYPHFAASSLLIEDLALVRDKAWCHTFAYEPEHEGACAPLIAQLSEQVQTLQPPQLNEALQLPDVSADDWKGAQAQALRQYSLNDKAKNQAAPIPIKMAEAFFAMPDMTAEMMTYFCVFELSRLEYQDAALASEVCAPVSIEAYKAWLIVSLSSAKTPALPAESPAPLCFTEQPPTDTTGHKIEKPHAQAHEQARP